MSYNYIITVIFFLLYERERGIKASLRKFISCIKPWIYWVIQNDCGMNMATMYENYVATVWVGYT
jgi:hypothetical protein